MPRANLGHIAAFAARPSRRTPPLATALRGRSALAREAAERRDASGAGCRAAGRSPRGGERSRTAMRAKHLSPRTEEAYLGWMRRYHEFHGRKDPAMLGAAHVTAFLNAFATERRVAASMQNQALAALLFLYREVLGVELPWLDDIVRARGPERLPLVMSRDEVGAVLAEMHGVLRLMAPILYGSGLRLLECCRLRAKDVKFARRQIIVRRGKGDKERLRVRLPARSGIE